MTNLMKMPFAAVLATAIAPLAAQESWDPQIKLTGGLVNIAEEDYIGQSKAYGIALAGAYPLFVNGSAVLEGGYKMLPTASVATVSYDTDIYFLGAMYRHALWWNGIYLQGGIRGTNAKTNSKNMDGGGAPARLKGDREVNFGWCFAAGYRLTDLWSFELGASSVGFKNVMGQAKSAMLIEAAFVIHR